MTATAALCYPYKAVQISQAEYNWVKDKLTTLYNSESSSKVSPSEEDKSKVRLVVLSFFFSSNFGLFMSMLYGKRTLLCLLNL